MHGHVDALLLPTKGSKLAVIVRGTW